MPEREIDNPDPAAFAAQNRDAMYRMITGSNPNDLREQVTALGGTRAAAQIAGVTQRTVQRWITQTGTQKIANPHPATLARVNASFSQARATREGRRRIAESRRGTLMRHQGARMRGTAEGGPVTAGREKGYVKKRTFTDYHLDASTMSATFDAFIEGGEEQAFTTFNDRFGEEYGGGGSYFDEWMFTDISGLGFNPDVGPGR